MTLIEARLTEWVHQAQTFLDEGKPDAAEAHLRNGMATVARIEVAR